MWAVSAAAVLAAWQLHAQAANMPPKAPDADAEIVSFRSDPILRLKVPIRINGRIHYFLVDTGAERSGVSLELARSLGLTTGASFLVTGFAGSSWVPSVSLTAVQFASSPSQDLNALAFSRDAIGADGFLGMDALRGQTVMFDFAARKAVVRRVPGFADKMIGPSARAKVRTRHGRLIFTKATASGLPVQAMLDTGSSITVGNPALRRALQARGRLGPAVPIRILAVTGEIISADYMVVKNLSIGGVTLHNMPVAFAEFAPFAQLGFTDEPALLLGMNALRKFDQVSIDFNRQEIRFTNRPPPSATD